MTTKTKDRSRDMTATTTTPKSVNLSPKKIKKTPKDDKGLKWFKGTRSSKKSNQKKKQLQQQQQQFKSPDFQQQQGLEAGSAISASTSSALPLPTPARVVEFEIEGESERVGVGEVLDLCFKDENEESMGMAVMMDSSSGLPILENLGSNQCGNPSCLYPSINPFSSLGVGGGTSTPPNSSNRGKGGKTKTSKTPKTPRGGGGGSSGIKFTHKKSSSSSLSLLNTKEDSSNSSALTLPPVPSTKSQLPEATYHEISDYSLPEAPPLPRAYIRFMEVPNEELADEIEYDLDEEDCAWLELINQKRAGQRPCLAPVSPEDMEFLMDRLEKESHFQMQSTGIDSAPLIDDDAVCCICLDGECENSNAILFCDMCNLAVHQNCYGVPYIPEGQWLCRKCLQSPSRPVDCILCPNKGGAFKQTVDGRWAHVNCVLWVPEVCFANTVFLEPVDSVENIPAARWKLTCFICKQKGVGACIQCFKASCYTAFHVTCAIQANLVMKMDTVRDANSVTVTVKKMAYCNAHAPMDLLLEKRQKEGDDLSSPRQKMKQTRKLLAEKRDALPIISVPTIPSDRIKLISQSLSFSSKKVFMKRLMAYWKLKRQTRNGVPLIRRLQSSSSVISSSHLPSSTFPTRRESQSLGVCGDADKQASENYGLFWIRLRQDLEKARLLCELVRKREKVKRTKVNLHVELTSLRIKPINAVFLSVLDELDVRDSSGIFAEPVDPSEVPDYLDYITQPMDLSTMRKKVESFEYDNLNELEADFNLMINNCLTYNDKDTCYYRDGLKFKDQGGIVFRYARRQADAVGYDSEGRHTASRPISQLIQYSDEEILGKIDKFMKNDSRNDLPPEIHIASLNELLDDALGISTINTKRRRLAQIKNEIVRLRKSSQTNKNKRAENNNKSSSANAQRQKSKNFNASLTAASLRRAISTVNQSLSVSNSTRKLLCGNINPLGIGIISSPVRTTRTGTGNLESQPELPESTSPSKNNLRERRTRTPSTSSPLIKAGHELRRTVPGPVNGTLNDDDEDSEEDEIPPRKRLRSSTLGASAASASASASSSPTRTRNNTSPTASAPPSKRSPSPNRKSPKQFTVPPPPPDLILDGKELSIKLFNNNNHSKTTTAPCPSPNKFPLASNIEFLGPTTLSNSQIFANALSCNKAAELTGEGAVKEVGSHIARNLFGVGQIHNGTATVAATATSTTSPPKERRVTAGLPGAKNGDSSLSISPKEIPVIPVASDPQQPATTTLKRKLKPPKLLIMPPIPDPTELGDKESSSSSSSSTSSSNSSSSSSTSNSSSSSSSSNSSSTSSSSSSCSSAVQAVHMAHLKRTPTSQGIQRPTLSPDILDVPPKVPHHHHHHHHHKKHKHSSKSQSIFNNNTSTTTTTPSVWKFPEPQTQNQSSWLQSSESTPKKSSPSPSANKKKSEHHTKPKERDDSFDFMPTLDLAVPNPNVPSFTTYRSRIGSDDDENENSNPEFINGDCLGEEDENDEEDRSPVSSAGEEVEDEEEESEEHENPEDDNDEDYEDDDDEDEENGTGGEVEDDDSDS